jgi:hypothetical protein
VRRRLQDPAARATLGAMDWMGWARADDYLLARMLLQRGVALVYLLAFVNVLLQWRPLLGERGLLPAPDLIARVSPRRAPSLFHWRYSDGLAMLLAGVGAVTSAALVVGLPQAGPTWVTIACFAGLWVLYLSFVNVGQVFYGFGWESLLLEAGFLAIFLGSGDLAPSWLVLLAFRWLLLRVELGAGLIKLRGDECWRRLTCTEHHHETQPLPGPLSWRFHHLPRWSHRVEVGTNHVVQLVVPFGLLLPQPAAGTAATLVIVTQAWLMVSGNFAWLNLVTIVLAFAALPDAWLAWVPEAVFGFEGVTHAATLALPDWYVVLTLALAVLLVWRSWHPVANLLSSRQRMNASHDPLRLVNSYGAFGSVTRTRHELVVEATDDPDAEQGGTGDGDAAWHPYGFRGKPGDPRRRPPQVAPYHLRLDWLLWFAAMGPMPGRELWFRRLLERLLDADPGVLRLVRHAPFGDEPPAAVRVLRYRYRFASPAQRREHGVWWIRDERTVVVSPISRSGRPRGPGPR